MKMVRRTGQEACYFRYLTFIIVSWFILPSDFGILAATLSFSSGYTLDITIVDLYGKGEKGGQE
jgi:hypothetical protein